MSTVSALLIDKFVVRVDIRRAYDIMYYGMISKIRK